VPVDVGGDTEAQNNGINGAGTANGKDVVVKQITPVAATVEEVAKEERV